MSSPEISQAGPTPAPAGARVTTPASAAPASPAYAPERRTFASDGSNESFGAYGDRLDGAKDWVRQNQKPAMLIAFATGVFLGVMMRS